jgi:hypothetical protein
LANAKTHFGVSVTESKHQNLCWVTGPFLGQVTKSYVVLVNVFKISKKSMMFKNVDKSFYILM